MRNTVLWKAVRLEVELTLDSTDYELSEKEINEITDEVISNDYIWQEFNESVLDIIHSKIGG